MKPPQQVYKRRARKSTAMEQDSWAPKTPVKQLRNVYVKRGFKKKNPVSATKVENFTDLIDLNKSVCNWEINGTYSVSGFEKTTVNAQLLGEQSREKPFVPNATDIDFYGKSHEGLLDSFNIAPTVQFVDIESNSNVQESLLPQCDSGINSMRTSMISAIRVGSKAENFRGLIDLNKSDCNWEDSKIYSGIGCESFSGEELNNEVVSARTFADQAMAISSGFAGKSNEEGLPTLVKVADNESNLNIQESMVPERDWEKEKDVSFGISTPNVSVPLAPRLSGRKRKNNVIDLNKRPLQRAKKKAPRAKIIGEGKGRVKKVAGEVKLKKTPEKTPKTPKLSTAKARKTSLTRRSCRRSLNFELELINSENLSLVPYQFRNKTSDIEETKDTNHIGSLQSYNSCLISSKKLGPNFPDICRKRRWRPLSTKIMLRVKFVKCAWVILRKKRFMGGTRRRRDFSILTAVPICNQFLHKQILVDKREVVTTLDVCNHKSVVEGKTDTTIQETCQDYENDMISRELCKDVDILGQKFRCITISDSGDKHQIVLHKESTKQQEDWHNVQDPTSKVNEILLHEVSTKKIKKQEGQDPKTKGNEIVLHKESTKKIKKKQGHNIADPNNKGNEIVLLAKKIKKQGQLVKVDLDQETQNMWDLIMNEKSCETEGDVDKEKEKYWEEERNIYRGRVESFISRMHLILGDRTFSSWKGSVLDSIIGVFLTQNVSDHLSSSAYLSLAAKYPVKRTNDHEVDGASHGMDSQESTGSNTESLFDQNLASKVEEKGTEEDAHIDVDHTAALDYDHMDLTTMVNPEEYVRIEVDDNDAVDYYHMDLTTMVKPEDYVRIEVNDNDAINYDHMELTTMVALGEDVRIDVDHNVTNRDQELSDGMTKNTESIQIMSGDVNIVNNHDQELSDGMTKGTESCQFTSEALTINDVNILKKKGGQERKKKKSDLSKEEEEKQKQLVLAAVKEKQEKEKEEWEILRKMYSSGKPRSEDHMDSVNWEAVRLADVDEVAAAIRERGQHRILAKKMQDCLNRSVEMHGTLDHEWLRYAPPDKVKEYLLQIHGLGLKSVECIRLLALEHLAFPVDVNVGRIAVRLGWVPLQTLPEGVEMHLLDKFPLTDPIQKYLWPRLCTLDQRTLYELHYQMITFGKVFCTKLNPNCNACPMRGECRHFASARASAQQTLPGTSSRGPTDKRVVSAQHPAMHVQDPSLFRNTASTSLLEGNSLSGIEFKACEPIVEMPESPVHQSDIVEEISDIEDFYRDQDDDSEEIPTIKLNIEEDVGKLWQYENEIDTNMSRALVVLTAEAASIPVRKLKNVSRLRTERQVYVLPDKHPILQNFEIREADDPCPYLLAIWAPGETSSKISNQESTSCNCGQKENNTVHGTILIPARTATGGSFPLNGTYFQTNEVFADDYTSQFPIDVPRNWIWNLPMRTTYFGTSTSTILRGSLLPEIQYCFWKGFVCVRGFDRKTRRPTRLTKTFHISTTDKLEKKKPTSSEESTKSKLEKTQSNSTKE
ncbi:transcriptional activator DEMETER-like [Quillaja saponaria]|uniref:Transcriptional activator DEMETER-like n=1 Tax=Quillaja saponaria TaxID=32244 RepID=A0AAD7VMS4_QUISA|nr:transcriptional activator DEMETER-like [Quillaja saponaria]